MNNIKQSFDLLVNVRRLKLIGPLHKSSSSIYLRFNKEKKLTVPDDPSNQRQRGPSIVNFLHDQSSCGFEINLPEQTNKLLVELMTPQLIALEDT